MKAALLLLVLLIREPSVVTIHGRVTNSSRGNGIAGATVLIPGLNLSAQTDSAGRYTLRSTGLAVNGSVTIEARRIGYSARSISVAIRGRTDITLDFALDPSMNRIDELVVSGVAAKAVGGNVPASGFLLRQREPGNTEAYGLINENSFMLARERPPRRKTSSGKETTASSWRPTVISTSECRAMRRWSG